jgi:hypothetical protein
VQREREIIDRTIIEVCVDQAHFKVITKLASMKLKSRFTYFMSKWKAYSHAVAEILM